jgi:GxxExxY protein
MGSADRRAGDDGQGKARNHTERLVGWAVRTREKTLERSEEASDASELLHEEITREILGAAFEVQRILGYGFLERVYLNSMVEELRRRHVEDVAVEQPVIVVYKGEVVGEYRANLFVAGKVVVEIKTEKEFNERHQVQLLHYLKATGIRIGILVNFGERTCRCKRLIM